MKPLSQETSPTILCAAFEQAMLKNNLPEMYEILCSAYFDINQIGRATPVIFIPVKEGLTYWVHIFLQMGANPNACTSMTTPIVTANYEKKHDLVALLLQHHAIPAEDIRENALKMAEDGTPLKAKPTDSKEMILRKLFYYFEYEYSRAVPPDFFTPAKNTYPELSNFIDDMQTRYGSMSDTPLSFACTHGHTEAVRQLIRCGAMLTFDNNKPLRMAKKNNHTEIVELLREAKANEVAIFVKETGYQVLSPTPPTVTHSSGSPRFLAAPEEEIENPLPASEQQATNPSKGCCILL